MRKKTETTKSILQQEALQLFDHGIQVFLSGPTDRIGICMKSEFEPITDRESLIHMCSQYPDANLEIVLDRAQGLIALGVGVGDHGQYGEESFRAMCERYGRPETLSYQLPSGEAYYIFKSGTTDFRPGYGSGMHLLCGLESLLAYPSLLGGQPVIKNGSETSIKEFTDWLNRGKVICLEPKEETATADQNGPGEEATSQAEAAALQASDETLANGANATPTEAVLSEEELLGQLTKNIVLFHDEKKDPHFFYEGEAFKAPSKTVENRVKYLYLQKTGSLPKSQSLKCTMAILESKARFEGSPARLANRVAANGDSILYDLHDKRYLEVTANKWEIIPASFPLYRRFTHMQPQVEPVADGDPKKVLEFLTIQKESCLLFLVYLISLFIPRIAHPVLAVFGDQGSAKSFLCTCINRLVDPTLTERIIQPKNERDLIQTLRQKYVTVLDNLSKIDNRVSDIFCQVCTGGSISLRQLYTDEGENIAQFRHVVILNSVSLAIVNSDLMDRSIILKLQRIHPKDRKPEEELWDEFEKARPCILGGIFDTIAEAMAIYPTLKLEHLPRLADFAKWGYAIAQALGESGEQFLKDFNANIKLQNESVVQQNVLCQAVLSLMVEQPQHLKSVADMHAKLKRIAGDDHRDETFPKLPHNLRKKLDTLRPTLLEHGITFKFSARQSGGIQILFSNIASLATSDISKRSPALIIPIGAPGVPNVAVSAETEIELDEMPEVVNA